MPLSDRFEVGCVLLLILIIIIITSCFDNGSGENGGNHNFRPRFC